MPARYGGEEFVVLLRNPGPDVAVEVGERVRAAVGGLDLGALRRRRASASRSAWPCRASRTSRSTTCRPADQALYRAKRAGRDRVVAA